MTGGLSLDESKEYIYSLDLTGIIDKLVFREGWIKSDAIDTSKLYRDFLFLIKKYGPMEPSQDVDDFWHHHLLNSPDYWDVTHNLFGQYLHHSAHTIVKKGVELNYIQNNLISFEESQKIYYNEFGKYITATKSRYPKIVYFFMRKICN